MDSNNIRNFVIIAHIDHGKSTLADRMLEITQTVSSEKMHPQMLDTMDLEQERGITIKLQPIRMSYTLNATPYSLNLIDTPGHVDFSYEVSRSLAAVEGAILLVDATRGIQAQTLANLDEARKHNLIIIPVINKIDLPNANIEEVAGELSELLNCSKDEILKVSAKTGEGVEEVLKKIITDVPAPQGEREAPFRALIFDSVYDSFRGIIAYVRVFEGQIRAGVKIKFLSTEKMGEVREVGEFKLACLPKAGLEAGEIGYIITGAKELGDVSVGDTITLDSLRAEPSSGQSPVLRTASGRRPNEVSPIPGFKIPQAMVFASFFSSGGDTNRLRTSLEKLKLNDSSLNFTPENSVAFGYGFKCGFLGLLHLEIVKERLEREYGLDLMVTRASVLYKEYTVGTKTEYEEPWVNLEVITPKEYLGGVMELLQARRGVYKNTDYISDRVILSYECPLSEIIIDFYDRLKSISSGYASQNYELIGSDAPTSSSGVGTPTQSRRSWRTGDLVKLEVIIAGEKVSEFDKIVPRPRALPEAKNLALKLKNLIPRQMFEVSIQVVVGGKILCREDISALKKDVTAKLYGGDRTRKDKLLKKQAAGKKKMKQIGRVQIPSNVFIDILRS